MKLEVSNYIVSLLMATFFGYQLALGNYAWAIFDLAFLLLNGVFVFKALTREPLDS